jgi:uridylate kinase
VTVGKKGAPKGKAVYKRILLKLSGDALKGSLPYGIDQGALSSIAQEIQQLVGLGIEVALVIGGGNIFRGVSAGAKGMDRVTADHMGMLATVINSLALQDNLEKRGVFTRVMTAIKMEQLAESYIKRRAVRHLEKGRVVIMAAGTGNPYFSTDTAAALRANEIRAEILVKATKVDGIYDDDPVTNPQAKRYNTISYDEVLIKHLRVMDATAISLCSQNKMPIVVCNMKKENELIRLVMGEKIGTLVT